MGSSTSDIERHNDEALAEGIAASMHQAEQDQKIKEDEDAQLAQALAASERQAVLARANQVQQQLQQDEALARQLQQESADNNQDQMDRFAQSVGGTQSLDEPVDSGLQRAMEVSKTEETLKQQARDAIEKDAETLFSKHNLTLNKVPFNGACLFNAVIPQLNSRNADRYDKDSLRQAVAKSSTTENISSPTANASDDDCGIIAGELQQPVILCNKDGIYKYGLRIKKP